MNPRFGWLVSYPKSGNTWMRMMLHSLRNEGELHDINDTERAGILNRTEFQGFFSVDPSDLTQTEIDNARPELHRAIARAANAPDVAPGKAPNVGPKKIPDIILRKVHDRNWFSPNGERIFPPEVSLGAVYIVRDPTDVAVSATHHYSVDLAESVRIMGDPKRIIARNRVREDSQFAQPLGTWSEHVLSWLDNAGMPVLLVRYEDMLADPIKQLTEVVNFLGLRDQNSPGAPEFSPAAIAAAVAAAKFENLRAQEEERGFSERSPGAERFFRKGRSGEGRELLSPELLNQLISDHKEVMSRLGYL